MSVVERLEDACVMLEGGRPEGALLCALTAASGASRLRFPRQGRGGLGDKEAFVKFLDEQFAATGTPRMNVHTPAGSKTMPQVIYELFRCSLSHEASLAAGGTFAPDPSPGRVLFRLDSLQPLRFTISHSALILVADLVAQAPEIAADAAQVRHRRMSRLPTYGAESAKD